MIIIIAKIGTMKNKNKNVTVIIILNIISLFAGESKIINTSSPLNFLVTSHTIILDIE